MGKALYIIVLGTFVAGSVLYLQTSNTKLATTTRQASYQEKVLAREIAKSAEGIAHLRLQKAGADFDKALGNINGFNGDGSAKSAGYYSGSMNNGTYRIRAIAVDGQNIKVETVGIYNGVEERIVSYHRVETLVVKEPSKLSARFIDSMAGWCSAVYLQQFIPISPGDSTGAVTGQISSDGFWFIKNPEMIFDSGHNRNGESVQPADIILETGTRMNFFIGVDKDCSEEGAAVETYNSDDYDHIHYAMDHETSISAMLEGTYAMIELNSAHDQTWRIAFEDQNFYTDQQYSDIKLNGYGDGYWDSGTGTWGGDGWDRDEDGYRLIGNHGSQPDYSDQVFEVKLLPCRYESVSCEVSDVESVEAAD